jgi:transcriptional regulator GlxA family with amidase domain
MNAPCKQTDFRPASSPLSGLAPEPGDGIDMEILLLVGFSQLSLAALTEPLNLANSLSGRSPFTWRLTSLDGLPVVSASGISIGVQGCFDGVAVQSDRPPALLICAGQEVEGQGGPHLRSMLRHAARRRVPVYAMGTASWLLADAGLLGDKRCTIHWNKMAAFAERFHDIEIDDALFIRDRQVVTCAGDFAAFDLAIDLVQQHCGIEIARTICQHLTADRWRDGASCQSAPPGLRHGATGRKLLQIIQLMERNIEDPLPLIDIARWASLSRRQVERLFERLLSTTPRQYYIKLRLGRARQLLELTEMPVTEIAIACGFASPSYFSKSFKEHFGSLPSQLRS